eukprot:3448471-Pleurochrysis_carterae.AAC.4
MVSKWTLLHARRVPAYLGSHLRPGSVRGTPKAYSLGTTTGSQLRWPPESQPSAGRLVQLAYKSRCRLPCEVGPVRVFHPAWIARY